jgi:tetratricopeptide (TPR) repeat protein
MKNAKLLAAGRRAYESGNLAQAESACRKVLRLDPDHSSAIGLLGLVFAESGRHELAESLLAAAIHQQGAKPDLCISLGCVLGVDGNLSAGEVCFRQALRGNPTSAEAHYHLGVNLTMQSRLEDAVPAFIAALRLKPDYAEACGKLANILQILGRPDDALAGYDQALSLKSDDPAALLQKARVLHQLNRPEEAAAAFQTAARRWNRHPDFHSEYGATLVSLGRYAEARARYESALDLDPDHPSANWNLSLLDLRLGRFHQGWQRYEWRFRQPGNLARQPGRRLWNGADLEGSPILLHSEQGLGDTLQFVRYAPMVEARGGVVTLECPRELASLLVSVRGVDRLVALGDALSEFEHHAPLMNLPGIFDTSLETIPASVPYLAPHPDEVEGWRQALSAPPGHLKVGIAWAGNPDHPNDRERSMTLAEVVPLLDVPRTAWFSLQKGAPGAAGITTLARFPADMAETAAVMANLDLVISVDTAVAHLAGATARPVWTLLPFVPDWRWMLQRDDTPWYPTMRLFRQPRLHDWPSTIRRVREELGSIVA